MPHLDVSCCRFPDNREGLGQNILRPGPGFYCCLELGGLCLQRLVVELFYLLFKLSGLLNDCRIALDQPLVAGAENLYKYLAYFVEKHRIFLSSLHLLSQA